MIVGFGLLLLLALAGLGKDGRGLPLYGAACAFAGATVCSGLLAFLTSFALIGLNGLAWAWLRRFAAEAPDRAAVLPVVGTLALLLALGLSGAGLGLAPVLGAGVVLAGLCGAAGGPPLVQFAGLLRAADGLIVVSCVLQSWPLSLAALSLWGVLAALGVTLLPRLAWRRVEEV
ncbi:hypothetical protein [Gluconobacter kanchanaburiensis]|uniref:Uncharacterized protein n=1 Tax=Gluconobacter kanchanaburiensis NBRC 103587 TaxID=1307948 RepID=A0A511BDC6_9PROT|nr:hypothetical protein [Gluconobacter kanchanaburiensis]MBF0861453.1 hypothetical protein [Gluconobacter kanchanaburiensis]GBR68326.1 hypothetical protein AA103587_0748 [Gluconobacter kanchanaburiensis NBRC 103587]GEK95817.1 hypothetical protein GKA01_10140 [Gluconobacter kanchanaburiensis NBRC 103587]